MPKPMTDEALVRAAENIETVERFGPKAYVHTCVARELLDEVLRLRAEVANYARMPDVRVHNASAGPATQMRQGK